MIPLKHQYESTLSKSASIALSKKMINFLKTEWPLYRIKVTINVSISLRERESFENAK